MNRAILRAALERARVNPRNYSLEGGLPNDAVCLEARPDGRWAVYYSERGSQFDYVEFSSEEAACSYMLGLLVSEPSARLPDLPPQPLAENEEL